MKFLIGSFIIIFCFLSCKKATTESVITNNSKDSLTYQPSMSGSKWIYVRTVGSISNTEFTFLRLTNDTMAYGRTFNVFSSNDNISNNLNQYTRQDGSKYYSILTGSTYKPELLVLDTLKNVNESWLGGVNGSDTYTFTMKEKIPSLVQGVYTFKNILVVHLDRSGPNPASGDTYYARGVGQIKSEGSVMVGGITFPTTVTLKTVELQ